MIYSNILPTTVGLLLLGPYEGKQNYNKKTSTFQLVHARQVSYFAGSKLCTVFMEEPINLSICEAVPKHSGSARPGRAVHTF